MRAYELQSAKSELGEVALNGKGHLVRISAEPAQAD